jgi:hypothetical protein
MFHQRGADGGRMRCHMSLYLPCADRFTVGSFYSQAGPTTPNRGPRGQRPNSWL